MFGDVAYNSLLGRWDQIIDIGGKVHIVCYAWKMCGAYWFWSRLGYDGKRTGRGCTNWKQRGMKGQKGEVDICIE